MASPSHSAHTTAGLLHSCCGRCCTGRYQVSVLLNEALAVPLSSSPDDLTNEALLPSLRRSGTLASKAFALFVISITRLFERTSFHSQVLKSNKDL